MPAIIKGLRTKVGFFGGPIDGELLVFPYETKAMIGAKISLENLRLQWKTNGHYLIKYINNRLEGHFQPEETKTEIKPETT